jgi:hypothetical protein
MFRTPDTGLIMGPRNFSVSSPPSSFRSAQRLHLVPHAALVKGCVLAPGGLVENAVYFSFVPRSDSELISTTDN